MNGDDRSFDHLVGAGGTTFNAIRRDDSTSSNQISEGQSSAVTGQSRKKVTALPRQVHFILRSKRRQTTRHVSKVPTGDIAPR
jgi:hypothetical protein